MTKFNQSYWDKKYIEQNTGWDISYVSPPIKAYIDQLTDKSIKILIPGCGNAYEGAYLYEQGFENTYLIDLSPTALNNFRKKFPKFPSTNIICGDVFEHFETYDLIIEQTFFCAINTNQRELYASHMSQILKPKGKLVGLLFKIQFNSDHPPFGGEVKDYLKLFEKHFNKVNIEDCYNSIKPRLGSEVFIKLEK